MTDAPPSSRKTRVLVTAFGAFPGAPSNPTSLIAARLARSRRPALLDVELVIRVLPVVYDNAAGRIAALIADLKPDAIIHLGLAARRKTMTVETRALNRLSQLRVDAGGQTPASPDIIGGAAPVLAARWPAARLAPRMSAAGAPTRLSVDAGDYVCNQTLYLTLAMTLIPAGFIHIPKPRPGRPDWRMGASADLPTIAQMTRAVERAALALASGARQSAWRGAHSRHEP